MCAAAAVDATVAATTFAAVAAVAAAAAEPWGCAGPAMAASRGGIVERPDLGHQNILFLFRTHGLFLCTQCCLLRY